jgi:hypothetical protein
MIIYSEVRFSMTGTNNTDLSFKVMQSPSCHEYQLQFHDKNGITSARAPVKSYPEALAQLLYQVAVDELEGADEGDHPIARKLLLGLDAAHMV